MYVDRDKWEKIVLNLISNAFKFTFEGEIAVTLRPSADGSRAELTIRDTGTGIPADQLPHIFDRFHRIEGSRGRSHEGSGIGLALVQELSKLHGGTVSVTSELDKGSAFTVSIPFGTAHLPAERIARQSTGVSTMSGTRPYVEEALRWAPDTGDVQAAGSVKPRSERVLVADDNTDMRNYILRLLSRHYKITIAADGVEAFDRALEERPDLILTDVMMPRLDGFGLLKALRSDPRT